MMSNSEEQELHVAARRRVVQVVIQYLFLGVILFVSAGSVAWSWGWVYLGAGVVILAINLIVLPREVVAERGIERDEVKPWDRRITMISIIPTLAVPVVAGLDYRFGWTAGIPDAVHLIGLLLFVLGSLLFTWAMASNKFFSKSVLVQLERDHTVAESGPYRFIRHPGYSGYITFTVGTPLLLGSLWGLIPSLFSASLLVLRTRLEDETLKQELNGYRDYALSVHYRLLPGVW
jgi:protein-S-isoprenylcysteine O-methyltransferase Ste14